MPRLKPWLLAIVLAALFLLSVAELAAFLELTGGQGLPAAQIVAWVQLHTDVTLILLFDADGCLIAYAEDTRYGFDQKARLARERAAS